MTQELDALIRPNIRHLKPYRCARDDYSAGILLDANENAFGPITSTQNTIQPESELELNRYPDPHLMNLRDTYAKWRRLPGGEWCMLGNGSDEVLDLIIRLVCEPGHHKILTCPPTYGMYKVLAQINNVEIVQVPLLSQHFQLDVDAIKAALDADATIKVVFLCSPGNPTGTCLQRADILKVYNETRRRALLVIDEAYIDFVPSTRQERGFTSMSSDIASCPGMLVCQTMSKSFGLAGIRLGICLASPRVIHYLLAIKPPYNINGFTAQHAQLAMNSLDRLDETVRDLNQQRDRMAKALVQLEGVQCIRGGMDANFLLVELVDGFKRMDANTFALKLYKQLAEFETESERVVVRFRGNEPLCTGCLRITIGTPEQNSLLLKQLKRLISRFDSHK